MSTSSPQPDPHRPSMVLEMVGSPSRGLYCLTCQQPWPCPDAPEDAA